MVVVARCRFLHVGVRVDRRLVIVVKVTTADVVNAALRVQRLLRHVRVELLQAVLMRELGRIVAQIAEILRPIVVDDIGCVFRRRLVVDALDRDRGAVERLGPETLLIPAPIDGRVLRRDRLDILRDVREVRLRILVGLDDLPDLLPGERQRLRRERQVDLWIAGNIRAGLRLAVGCLIRAVGRLLRRGVLGAAGEWRAVRQVRQRLALRVRLIRMLDPLRIADLARDHRDRVRRRGASCRLMEIVEQRKTVRVLPEERYRVAVDVRDHDLALLLRLQRGIGGRRDAAAVNDRRLRRCIAREMQALLIEHVAIVQRLRLCRRVIVKIIHVAIVAMVNRVRILGI